MGITEQERDIIRRILGFDEETPTDLLPEVGYNPVSNYNDPAKLRFADTSAVHRRIERARSASLDYIKSI